MADSRATSEMPAKRGRKPANDTARQNLLAEPRRMKILEWLQEEGSARVRDLSVAWSRGPAAAAQLAHRAHLRSPSASSRAT